MEPFSATLIYIPLLVAECWEMDYSCQDRFAVVGLVVEITKKGFIDGLTKDGVSGQHDYCFDTMKAKCGSREDRKCSMLI
jgi:hypothetical protein